MTATQGLLLNPTEAPTTAPEPVTYDQALQASTDYFQGDSLAASTFLGKYALKTPAGEVLEPTPDQMHDRIAAELHRTELKYPDPTDLPTIRRSLQGFKKIVPQGSPMFGIGNPFVNVSLSNCVVVQSPRDSFSGIMATATELTHLFKRRAGVGLSLDTLRPESLPTNNAAKETSGAFSFADLYSFVTRMVGQNGRRGALMLTMDARHPDIARFIAMKQDVGNVTGANVSVMLGDAFMTAATTPGAQWTTAWAEGHGIEVPPETLDRWLSLPGHWVEKKIEFPNTRETDEPHPPLTCHQWHSESPEWPRLACVRRFVAADLWSLLNRCARNTAEPGLLFWDNYRRTLPADCYPQFKSVSTNPCSEIALSPYDSCRLLSLNLTGFVKDPFTPLANFDFADFQTHVRLAVRLLDDIVDLEIEALQRLVRTVDEQDEKTLWEKLLNAAVSGRRTGLGTHGLADTFAQLGLRYDSKPAQDFAETLYRTLRDEAYLASADLAVQRGAFPVFDWQQEKDCPFFNGLPEETVQKMAATGRRNVSILTNAPTGTVSLLSQTSSGIEPTFRHFYVRRKKVSPTDLQAKVDFTDQSGDSWQHFQVFEKNVADYLAAHPKAKSEWDLALARSNSGDFAESLQTLTDDLDDILPGQFVHSAKIDPHQRVSLQATVQKYIDHGISSTINMPESATTDQVREVYEQAWKQGLKGITVYRDNCRTGVLVTSPAPNKAIVEKNAPRRPATLACDVHHATVDGGTWTVCIGLLDEKPYEVFAGPASTVHLPKSATTGTIVKVPGENKHGDRLPARYDLVLGDDNDPLVLRDIANTFDDSKYGWATRQLSTSLRHGVPIRYIVQQLARSKSTGLHSFNRAIARVLATYLDDQAGGRFDPCINGNCE